MPRRKRTTHIRTATYNRRSAAESPSSLALDAQEARVRAYLDSRPGWRPVEPLPFGGTEDRRPSLRQLLVAAQAEYVDGLLMPGVERLSDSPDTVADILSVADDGIIRAVRAPATSDIDTE